MEELKEELQTIGGQLESGSDRAFYRNAARLLNTTRDLETIARYIDVDRLVDEFSRIKIYLPNPELEESLRGYWEDKVRELSGEETPEVPKKSESETESEEEASAPSRDRYADSANRTQEDARQTEPPAQTGSVQDVTELSRTIGRQLSEIRQDQGVSQDDLADKLNMSERRLIAFERGQREMNLATLEQLAELLEFEVNLKVEKDADPKELKNTAKQQIIRVLNEIEMNENVREICQVVLYQLLEQSLQHNRFTSVQQIIEHLVDRARDTDVIPKSADGEGPIVQFITDRLNSVGLSEAALKQKVEGLAMEVLKDYHNRIIQE